MYEWLLHNLDQEAYFRLVILEGIDLVPVVSMEWWTWDIFECAWLCLSPYWREEMHSLIQGHRIVVARN